MKTRFKTSTEENNNINRIINNKNFRNNQNYVISEYIKGHIVLNYKRNYLYDILLLFGGILLIINFIQYIINNYFRLVEDFYFFQFFIFIFLILYMFYFKYKKKNIGKKYNVFSINGVFIKKPSEMFSNIYSKKLDPLKSGIHLGDIHKGIKKYIEKNFIILKK